MEIKSWFKKWAVYIVVGIALVVSAVFALGAITGADYHDESAANQAKNEETENKEEQRAIEYVEPAYDPSIDESAPYKISFGDGCFCLEEDPSEYIENGMFDFRLVADNNDHIDDLGGADGELVADMIPESGSHIAVHGVVDGSDRPYIEASGGSPACSIRIEFEDSPEERTLRLADGSAVSPLMAEVAQYYLETSGRYPARVKARFLHFEELAKSTRVSVAVNYDIHTRLATWDDVERTDIAVKDGLFLLRQTAEKNGFLAETPIKGSGVSYHHYASDADRSQPEAELRVYGSWRGEDPYFEAVLNGHTTVRVMFRLGAGGELVELENGSKIPVLMAKSIKLALQSLARYPDYFEERFDALGKSGRPGVQIDIANRNKTSEAKLATNDDAITAIEQYGDGWITTRKDAAAWIKDGQLDLNGLALNRKWRVDPATVGEITLFPQKTLPGNYMILSSYNIKVYGGGADAEYAYVLLSGPWFRIKVEFADFGDEETVQLENGRIIPQRAVWVVEKAIEVLNEDVNIYDVFEGLKESCPKGVKINAAHFS